MQQRFDAPCCKYAERIIFLHFKSYLAHGAVSAGGSSEAKIPISCAVAGFEVTAQCFETLNRAMPVAYMAVVRPQHDLLTGMLSSQARSTLSAIMGIARVDGLQPVFGCELLQGALILS